MSTEGVAAIIENTDIGKIASNTILTFTIHMAMGIEYSLRNATVAKL